MKKQKVSTMEKLQNTAIKIATLLTKEEKLPPSEYLFVLCVCLVSAIKSIEISTGRDIDDEDLILIKNRTESFLEKIRGVIEIEQELEKNPMMKELMHAMARKVMEKEKSEKNKTINAPSSEKVN